MSLKAASTLSRAVGASLRPLLSVRSVGAEFAAASVLWPPPCAPKPPQAPSLLRHTSSVAGAAAAEPPKASEVLPSTEWWTELEESQQEKLLKAFDGLNPQGRVAKLALAALKKLKDPPDANLLRAFVSSGFIAQVDLGLRYKGGSEEIRAKFLAELLALPVEVSLELAQGGELMSSIGMQFENRVAKVWVKKLATFLSEAEVHFTELVKADKALEGELRRHRLAEEAKLQEEQAKLADLKSALKTCEANARPELWGILKGSGVVDTICDSFETSKSKHGLSVLEKLGNLKLAILARRKAPIVSASLLPRGFPQDLAKEFQLQLEDAIRGAWFNERTRKGKVVNFGVPFRSMLLRASRGEAAAKAQLENVGVTDQDFINAILKSGETHSSIIDANFGWLLDAGDAVNKGNASSWPVLRALEEGWTVDKLNREQGIKWSTGCHPIFVGNILEGVVLRLPIWGGQPFLFKDAKTGLTKKSVSDLIIYGLRPAVHGFHDVEKSKWPMRKLYLSTFVLTRGRAKLLKKTVSSEESSRLGVMTTAVHGTGKSATLRTLALILSVGAGGNVMYMPMSNVLAPGSSLFEQLPSRLMQGGLSMSCGDSVCTPKLFRDMAAIGIYGSDAHEALKSMFLSEETTFNKGISEGEQEKESQFGALIIDEANRLQKLLADEKTNKEPAEWWKHLESLFSWTEPSDKIFAFSPDFHASQLIKNELKGVQETFNSQSSKDLPNPFYELERCSPELAFKLMMGPQASDDPLNILDKIDEGEVKGVGRGEDVSLQLPSAAVQLLDDEKLRTNFLNLIVSLGVVPRDLRVVVNMAKEATPSKKNAAWFREVLGKGWLHTLRLLESKCEKRLDEATSDEIAKQAGGISIFLDHSLAALSILSRTNPDELSLRANSKFSSHVARHAYMRALFKCHTDAMTSDDPERRDAWERLLSGAGHIGTGEQFEGTVTTLLEMGLFGSKYIPLSAKASKTPIKMLLRHSFMSDAARLPEAKVLSDATGAGLSLVDVREVQTLAPGKVHVVRTPHSFPTVDFVVFRRPHAEEGGKANLQVAFIETTISSLKVHGANKTPSSLIFAGTRPKDSEEVEIPPTLKDIASLAFSMKYFTELKGSEVKFRYSEKEPAEKKTSMANSILWSFGIPIDLNAKVECRGDKFSKLVMSPALLEAAPRKELEETTAKRMRELPDEPRAPAPILKDPSQVVPKRGADEGAEAEGTSGIREAEDESPAVMSVDSMSADSDSELSEDMVDEAEQVAEADAQKGGIIDESLIPLTKRITDTEHVDLFFVYCTPTEQDKGGHTLDQADIPGFFGVFGQNYLPPSMIGLSESVPMIEELSSPFQPSSGE